MEWERHWNTICLGIVTIASAALGTAIFASNPADIDLTTKDNWGLTLAALKFGLIIIAMVLHMLLVALSGRAIFHTAHSTDAIDKSQRVLFIYWLFWFEVFVLVVLLTVNLFDDQVIRWSSQAPTPPEPTPSPP